jgi:BRO1-like domain
MPSSSSSLPRPLWVLPFRVPQPCDDLVEQLSQWLDDEGDEEEIEDGGDRDEDGTRTSHQGGAAAAAEDQGVGSNQPETTSTGKKDNDAQLGASTSSSLSREERNPRPDFRSSECLADLHYLADCRRRLGDLLESMEDWNGHGQRSNLSSSAAAARKNGRDDGDANGKTTALADDGTKDSHHEESGSTSTVVVLTQTLLPLLQEYAAALHEFCIRGFPVTDLQGEGLTLTWKSITMSRRDFLEHASSSSSLTAWETHYSLAWERANVLFNIAICHCHQAASWQALDSRVGWTKAGVSWQQAATVVQYLRSETMASASLLAASSTLAPYFLQLWESYLLAEAQRAAYQTFFRQARPKHFMLAKLAAAAAPLYGLVEKICAQRNASSLTSTTGNTSSSGSTGGTGGAHHHSNGLLDWEDSARAWGMWMTALAEHHQSIVHREKQERGLELARLEGALKFGNFCKEFCESSGPLLDNLTHQVWPVLQEIDQRLEVAETENDMQYHETVPEHDELPEVAPQLSVKTDLESIGKLLPPLSKPMFTGILDASLRRHVDTFRSEIQNVVAQTEWLVESKTTAARQALAAVSLPHSLTAYRQQQAGGGIPTELWDRIEKSSVSWRN